MSFADTQRLNCPACKSSQVKQSEALFCLLNSAAVAVAHYCHCGTLQSLRNTTVTEVTPQLLQSVHHDKVFMFVFLFVCIFVLYVDNLEMTPKCAGVPKQGDMVVRIISNKGTSHIPYP